MKFISIPVDWIFEPCWTTLSVGAQALYLDVCLTINLRRTIRIVHDPVHEWASSFETIYPIKIVYRDVRTGQCYSTFLRARAELCRAGILRRATNTRTGKPLRDYFTFQRPEVRDK